MKIGSKIKHLRKEKNISQQGLAELLKIDRGTVAKWEIDMFQPDRVNKEKLSKIFNKPVSYFNDDDYLSEVDIIPLEGDNNIKIPIFSGSAIPCGFPAEYTEADVMSYLVLPRSMTAGARMGIVADGDSMTPQIQNGDTLLIKTTNEAMNNRVMLVKTESGFTVKRIVKKNGTIYLHSDNTKYEPFIPKSLEIIGLVVRITKEVE